MPNFGSLHHPHILEESPVAHWPDPGSCWQIQQISLQNSNHISLHGVQVIHHHASKTMDILHHNYCYEVAVTWDKQKRKWEVLLHAPEHPIKFQVDLSSHLGVYRLYTLTFHSATQALFIFLLGFDQICTMKGRMSPHKSPFSTFLHKIDGLFFSQKKIQC